MNIKSINEYILDNPEDCDIDFGIITEEECGLCSNREFTNTNGMYSS